MRPIAGMLDRRSSTNPGITRRFCGCCAKGLERYPVELFAFTLMPNHWHMVLRPAEDGVTVRDAAAGLPPRTPNVIRA